MKTGDQPRKNLLKYRPTAKNNDSNNRTTKF